MPPVLPARRLRPALARPCPPRRLSSRRRGRRAMATTGAGLASGPPGLTSETRRGYSSPGCSPARRRGRLEPELPRGRTGLPPTGDGGRAIRRRLPRRRPGGLRVRRCSGARARPAIEGGTRGSARLTSPGRTRRPLGLGGSGSVARGSYARRLTGAPGAAHHPRSDLIPLALPPRRGGPTGGWTYGRGLDVGVGRTFAQ